MPLRSPDVPHEEGLQQLAADIDNLLRELIAASRFPTPERDAKLRLVNLKLDSLKLRVSALKQSLHEHLRRLDERRLQDRTDVEARYLTAASAERLADLWLMEGLLDRLAGPMEKKIQLARGYTFELPSTCSSEIGESV